MNLWYKIMLNSLSMVQNSQERLKLVCLVNTPHCTILHTCFEQTGINFPGKTYQSLYFLLLCFFVQFCFVWRDKSIGSEQFCTMQVLHKVSKKSFPFMPSFHNLFFHHTFFTQIFSLSILLKHQTRYRMHTRFVRF